jgi:predicted O-methyltransferase YrrM
MLYSVVVGKRPKLIIEYGVLHGYSAVAMAQGLRDGGGGTLIAYDLWGKYKYKHGDKAALSTALALSNLYKYVHLRDGDFNELIELPDFDVFFLDISNTGKEIIKLEELTRKQREKGAIVLFEGGTKERDKVSWMVQYNKKPIVGCGVDYVVLDNRFPSLSMLI